MVRKGFRVTGRNKFNGMRDSRSGFRSRNSAERFGVTNLRRGFKVKRS